MFAFISRLSKRTLIIMASAIGAVVVAVPAITVGVVVSNAKSNDDFTYTLSRTMTNATFRSEDVRFRLPDIKTNDPDFAAQWEYKSGSSEEYKVASLVDDKNFSLHPIDVDAGTDKATAVFTAKIQGSKGAEVSLDFTVNVTDKGSDVFDTLSSNQRGHIDYISQGIGRSRVFGLYDINLPKDEDGKVLPVNTGNFKQVIFENSFDEFRLGWNYRGSGISIDVRAVDIDGTNVGTVQYDGDKSVRVNFNKAGTFKVIAENQIPYRDGLCARYEYIYEVVDAVNVRDFDDIKLMEKLARYDYITNGVKRQDDGGVIRTGASLGEYTEGDPSGLLSKHFKKTATPYPAESSITAADMGGNSDRYQSPGYFFNEFNLWAPDYRHKDLAIRSAHKTEETRRMYTWAESTWFFGSVYGNGYEINATTYTRGGVAGYTDGNYTFEGVYRNSHSMRGREPGTEYGHGESLGFDGKQFFPGYGWGEAYAFYALANNSTIDNITLTGEDIPQGSGAIKLNQFRKIGVLGTSTMHGKDRVFSQGNAHVNGVPVKGLYIEGIRVQNSILEKGLTLFGASFAPDVNNPCVSDTNVFRFAGFAAILGNAYGGGLNDEDTEKGEQVSKKNHLAIRDEQERKDFLDGKKTLEQITTAVTNRNGGLHGNFIVARNSIYHDVSTSSLLSMPSRSGTMFDVVGNENYFYSWLKSNEIQFPEMKHPNNEGLAIMTIMGAKGNLNSNIPTIMNYIFDKERKNHFDQKNNNDVQYWQDKANSVYLVNVPAIAVVAEGSPITNTFSFANSSIGTYMRDDFAKVSDAFGGFEGNIIKNMGLDQGFHLTMLYSPTNAPAEANLVRAEEITPENINMRMNSMTPAGTKTPMVVAKTVVTLGGEETSVKLHSALKGQVTSGLAPITLAGHSIQYKGKAVTSTYSSAEDCFVLTHAELIAQGITDFGIHGFDLVNTETGQRVSSFSILLQGTKGDAPNVVQGSIGYTGQNIIQYGLSLEGGNTLLAVTLSPRMPLDYTFTDNVLRFEGVQLYNGANTILVETTNWVLIITQNVDKKEVFADAYAVNISNNSAFVIDLAGGVSTEGLAISINGRNIDTFSRNDRRITISNATVQSTLAATGASYTAGQSCEVKITNTSGLIKTNLVLVGSLSNVSVAGVTSYTNKSPGHRDFRDVVVELSSYQGQNILGVAFSTGDTAPALTASSVIRYDEGRGFKITQKPGSENYLLTIPASVIAQTPWLVPATFNFIAGGNNAAPVTQQYRIAVYTGVSSDGVQNNNFTVRIYDPFVEGESINFAQDAITANLASVDGVLLGLTAPIYLYDHKEMPLFLPATTDWTASSFENDGNTIILAIYDSTGKVVATYTRNQIMSGAAVAFETTDGTARRTNALGTVEGRYVTAITIRAAELEKLGVGTFTVAVQNRYNICYTELKITDNRTFTPKVLGGSGFLLRDNGQAMFSVDLDWPQPLVIDIDLNTAQDITKVERNGQQITDWSFNAGTSKLTVTADGLVTEGETTRGDEITYTIFTQHGWTTFKVLYCDTGNGNHLLSDDATTVTDAAGEVTIDLRDSLFSRNNLRAFVLDDGGNVVHTVVTPTGFGRSFTIENPVFMALGNGTYTIVYWMSGSGNNMLVVAANMSNIATHTVTVNA